MSWDVEIIDPATGCVAEIGRHSLAGGTYAAGGTTRAEFNITYNYGHLFRQYLDADKGIKVLEGKTVAQTIDLLKKTVAAMPNEKPGPDYWKATPGNVKRCLEDLVQLATASPQNGVWRFS